MAFCTYYKYDGELRHIGKNDIDRKNVESLQDIDEIWAKITALVNITPSNNVTDNNMSWLEWSSMKLVELREELNEAYWWLMHTRDAIESRSLDPKNITDDGDEYIEKRGSEEADNG